MPTGQRPLQEIAMDFVGELLRSEGYNLILVVTDRFTKVQNHVSAQTSWTAADIANAYMNDQWRRHELSQHITSDPGPQFVYKFSKELKPKLRMNQPLSTAYHPQTDALY